MRRTPLNTIEQTENQRGGAWILNPYRIDCYGSTRTEFQICEAALNHQADMIALVCRALTDMGQEAAINEHTQVLTAAKDILSQAVETMNAVLTTLADCKTIGRD